MKNELSSTTSPYLLQHAKNPVHWKVWNAKNIQYAISENKLLLISIGYSACHWCHVMEHECFEDKDVAVLMNQNYINIKIDREEHPDVDSLYMKALQLMTQSGGWPLNIVALPDGRPIWGSTYLPKGEWIEALTQLHKLQTSKPEILTEYAQQLSEGIEIISKPILSNDNSKKFSLEPFIEKWSKSFDMENGGYQRTPKFMMPSNLDFLQSYGYLYNRDILLEYIDITLTKMAWGGIFDTVHGGFSRYSVDHSWHIPHFEKMLYDNAQLLTTYSNAYKRTKNPLFKNVVKKTTKWLIDELHTAEGGFMSALDADSISDSGKLEEGAFYRWTLEELQDLLHDDFSLFNKVYNINETGYWEGDYYIFIQNKPLGIIANEMNLKLELLEKKIKHWNHLLLTERNKRNKPRLDYKVITSWNAMLLSGLIDAQTVLKSQELEIIISQLQQFILKKCTNSDFTIKHIYNYEEHRNGLLEDYAFVIKSLLDIYNHKVDKDVLELADKYTKKAIESFYSGSVGFFRSSDSASLLFTEQYITEDQVIPSDNSIMCENLFRLFSLTETNEYSHIANQMLDRILGQVDYPSAYSHWLQVYLSTTDLHKKITISGIEAEKKARLLTEIYIPNSEIIIKQNRQKNSFLICYKDRCLLPFYDFNLFLDELEH